MKLIRISTFSLLFCALGWAQTSERISNFIVKDKKGIPVKTLTADQIEFKDDGVVVAPGLKLFDGTDVVEAGQRKPAELLRRVRLIPILFEGLDNEQRRLAKQIAYDLLKEDKDPNHLFSVFKISNQLSILQPFTTNREDLRKAIDIAVSGVANVRYAEVHKESKAKLTTLAANRQQLTEEDLSAGKLDASPALQGTLARLQLAMMNDSIIDDAEGTRRTIAFMNSMVVGLKSIPGRKAIIYLTAGIRLSTNLDVPFQSMHARANDAGVAFYPFDCSGITVAARGENVIDSTAANLAVTDGGGTQNTERGDRTNAISNATEGLRQNGQSPLRTLTESTGGVMSLESNDPKRQLREMIADTSTYYELTYDPKITDYNGVFRKTELKLKQGDYRLRSRDGYLAMPPGQENLLPYELPLVKALAAAVPVRDIEFRSGTWKLKSTKDSVQGMVVVEVPFAGLSFAQDAVKGLYAARISMVIQIRDPQGNVVEKFSRDLPLKGNLQQLDALKASNFNFREKFSVLPGRYVIETAVIDQLSNKVGTRKTSFVAAAAAAPIAMSSVTVVRNFQPGVKDIAPEEPFQFQGGRITPTLNTTLKAVKGAQMALFFVVYPELGVATPPQAIVQYFKDGELAGSANLQLPAADAQGRINYVLSSPLDAMPPGNYEVKVIIKQGNSAVTESAYLTIGA